MQTLQATSTHISSLKGFATFEVITDKDRLSNNFTDDTNTETPMPVVHQPFMLLVVIDHLLLTDFTLCSKLITVDTLHL